MYNTNTKLSREFVRRMIRAYEQDLLELVAQTPEHPGGDWAQDHLHIIEQIRQQTYTPFEQTITF